MTKRNEVKFALTTSISISFLWPQRAPFSHDFASSQFLKYSHLTSTSSRLREINASLNVHPPVPPFVIQIVYSLAAKTCPCTFPQEVPSYELLSHFILYQPERVDLTC